MKRKIACALVAAVLAIAALPLAAQTPASTPSNAVSLGISIGPTFPAGNGVNITTDNVTSFNWGFYVNIPLVYAFDVMPSAEVYKFKDQQATDIDLAFKFLVPINDFSIYAGIVPGLTAVSTVLDPHVGILAGASYRLVSNLSGFLQGKYNFVFDSDRNIRVFHLNAGILLAF